MTVRELMDVCARHEHLDDEIRIEIQEGMVVTEVRGVRQVNTDPDSGMFFIATSDPEGV